ncbi:MAG: hypothetical protein M3460_17905 [Actinomycetota bacterium]|nr:hypothetical protein [Actinomycetota bacterium]
MNIGTAMAAFKFGTTVGGWIFWKDVTFGVHNQSQYDLFIAGCIVTKTKWGESFGWLPVPRGGLKSTSITIPRRGFEILLHGRTADGEVSWPGEHAKTGTFQIALPSQGQLIEGFDFHILQAISSTPKVVECTAAWNIEWTPGARHEFNTDFTWTLTG